MEANADFIIAIMSQVLDVVDIYPFEVQSGMDVMDVRRRYGRDFRIWGGVDKRALAHGPAAIVAELARLKPLIAEGVYIPHTDHSCPPDISFPNYCYYLKRLAEACGLMSER